MSKRYIFNERLNKRSRRRSWFVGLAVTLLLANVVASELNAQESPQLLNPNAAEQTVFQSTLKDIAFTRSANQSAVTTFTFSNSKGQPQLIEAKGKLVLTLPKTELGKDQLVELDVTEFGTPVTTIETFQEKESSRVVFNYEGKVVANTEQDGKTLRVSISPMSEEQVANLERSQY